MIQNFVRQIVGIKDYIIVMICLCMWQQHLGELYGNTMKTHWEQYKSHPFGTKPKSGGSLFSYLHASYRTYLFHLFLFPTCSHQVPNVFPKVVPIAPCFNPICFAQSPPPLMYIAGPKHEALHLFIEAFILGNLHSFNFVLQFDNCVFCFQNA